MTTICAWSRWPFVLLMLMVASALAAGPPTVQVEPSDAVGRQVEKVTETSVVRDYLKAWQSLDSAMQADSPEPLDAYFVGLARDKLLGTIRQQRELGIETHYEDRSHDVRLVFYSPEGLSIQLVDTVEYDLQLVDHGKALPVERVHARYVAVLTPAENRWKVRIFQAEPVK